MRLAPDDARRRAAGADHGVLGTVRAGTGPDLVPACFVIDGDVVGVPIDRVKAKASTDLQRERDLAADPRATLLLEHWDPGDWSRLWWVRLRLERSTEATATIERLETLLRDRYPQYATAAFVRVLTFRIVEGSGWAASPT